MVCDNSFTAPREHHELRQVYNYYNWTQSECRITAARDFKKTAVSGVTQDGFETYTN